METNSQNNTANEYRNLEEQIRECFGRVVYTHKTHEKCVNLALKFQSRLKTAQILISALITSSFFPKLLGENSNLPIQIGAVLSFVLLIINTFSKEYDPGSKAEKHRTTAIQLWNIRESYLSLLVEIRNSSLSLDDLFIKRDELQKKLLEIYAIAPRTSEKGYKEARKSLKDMEEYTFSSEEIDKFLPENLRYNKTIV